MYLIFNFWHTLSLLKIGPMFFQRIYTCDKAKRECDCTTNTSGPLFEINGFDLIWFIVLNTTFSNISAISWRPVLVVDEAGVPGENHRPWACNWQTVSLVSRAHLFCNLQYKYRAPLRRIGQEYSARVAFSIFQSLKRIQPLPVCAGFFICIQNSLDRSCVTMPSWSSPLKCKVSL